MYRERERAPDAPLCLSPPALSPTPPRPLRAVQAGAKAGGSNPHLHSFPPHSPTALSGSPRSSPPSSRR